MSLLIDPYRFAATTFDPSIITWKAAYWASDPLWSNPGDGNEVTSWRDYSGNSLTLSRVGGVNGPTYRASVTELNNQPGIDFDGINDRLWCTTTTGTTQPDSIVLIVRADSISANKQRWIDNQTGTGDRQLVEGAYVDGKALLWAGSLASSSLSATTGAYFMTALFNGASSWIERAGTRSATINPNTAGLGGIMVGNANSIYADGVVAFAGVYDGDITANANWATFKAGATATYGVTT